MLSRALPAAQRLAALGAPHPISTGNLLADCERWCRDHLRPQPVPAPRASTEGLTRNGLPDPRRLRALLG